MNRIPGAKIFIDEAFYIHTVRCGHASADPAETYVQAACRLGLKRITFTDHGPFPGNPFSGRMRIEELDDYEKELKALRKQYDRRIDICIGLEIEYLPEYRSYYEMLHERFDLLLLGQHHTSMSDGRYTFEMSEKNLEARALANGMIAAVFFVCFDLFQRGKKYVLCYGLYGA